MPAEICLERPLARRQVGARRTDAVYRAVRGRVARYRDDRPLADDIDRACEMLRARRAGEF